MTKTAVMCNIPHAGLSVPDWAKVDFIVNESEINRFARFMVDLDVDKLFSFVPSTHKEVANISRIVVDVERYRNDENEPMAKLGMGVCYEKNEKGEQIRCVDSSRSQCLLEYDRYHLALQEKIDVLLEKAEKVMILDCHSFHDKMYYTGYHPSTFPDVCIGYNDNYSCPLDIREKIFSFFEKTGFSVAYNYPFSGTLIPEKFTNNSRVQGMMLELNRRVYEKNPTAVAHLCRKVYDILREQ